MAKIDTSSYQELTQSIIAIFDESIEIIPAIKEEFTIVPCFLPEEVVKEANDSNTVIAELEDYITEKYKYKFPIEIQLNSQKGFLIRLAIGKDGGFREHTIPIIMGKVKNRVIEDKKNGSLKVPFRLSKDELALLDNKVNQKSLLNEILKLINIPKDDIESFEFSSIGVQMRRHTPFDSAKQRMYITYGGKLGAKLTTLFTPDYLNYGLLDMESKEFITKTLKAFNMDINVFKQIADMEDKKEMSDKVFITLQYGLERLLVSDNIMGGVFHIPTGRLFKELEKLEKEIPFFTKEYFKKEKSDVKDLASFQLYIMTLAEAVIRDAITTNYFMNIDRYGYKTKIDTLIKYILADAKHPEIKEARALVIELMNQLNENNPAFSVVQSQELISKYHGLNKNFEVVDVASVIKSLEEIKREIDALNTLINPTFKLISLERKVLVYIDQVGVEINTKESKSLSKLRYIISSLKNPKAKFRKRDLQTVLNLSTSFIKGHIVKDMLEYQATIKKSLNEESEEYQAIKAVLGEYPYKELVAKLIEKGKLAFAKTIKLDKHVDNTKEKKDNESDSLQDGYVHMLINGALGIINYIDKEKTELDNRKKSLLNFKDEVLALDKSSSAYKDKAKQFDTMKKEYDKKLSDAMFSYKELEDDLIISINEKALNSPKLEQIRSGLLRGANALFDTQIEVMKNLEVLNGRKAKSGITIGFLKELLNVWDIKEKQLQIKYKELKNAQGEQNQHIEDEVATLIAQISEFLVEKQQMDEPMNNDAIYIPYMPKNNIQIIEAQISEMMGKKNNSQEVIRKFVSDYTYTSSNPDQAKLKEGVMELLRRKNIHEQDKDKFISMINKHFDLLKEKEETQEKLLIDFEMPQRLISQTEESSIMRPIDTSKDMKESVSEAIKEEQTQEDIEEIYDGKKPKHIFVEEITEKLSKIDCNCSKCKVEFKTKYQDEGEIDSIIVASSFRYEDQKEVYKKKISIPKDKDFEDSVINDVYNLMIAFAKNFLSKIENVRLKKEISDKLKIYLTKLKSIKG
jgi:hypothetical protein